MAAAIEVEQLCKRYGQVMAVDHVNFKVNSGELVGYLGPNGAGKSTSMRVLTTFLPASSGYARVCGFDVMNNSMEVRECIGYLPESVPIYPEMRVEEYLQYRAKLKGCDRSTRNSRIEYCLERCRIKEVRRRLAGTLSKGYRQRVGLADAMLANPKVLILDEPTSGLDPIQIRETLNTIKELAGTHTVLLSTHILSEVEAICDRVIIINRGQLKWDGKLSQLAEQHPTLVMEVRGPREPIQEWLRKEEGVLKVHSIPVEPDVTSFEVEIGKRTELRENLGRKVIERGWNLRRLDLRRQRLEDLYMNVVLRSNATAGRS
jgi:ABC-2 type transport system ATP-binding protein